MIKLDVVDRKRFVVRGTQPFRVEAAIVKDGVLIAHVYEGEETDMDQEPVGAFDGTLPDDMLTNWTWAGEEDDAEMYERLEAAKKELKDLLSEVATAAGAEHDELDVYYWSWVGKGPRVAEISLVKHMPDGGSAGMSFMQYDPGNEALLLMCERFLLDSALGEEDGGLPDVWRERIRKEFMRDAEPFSGEWFAKFASDDESAPEFVVMDVGLGETKIHVRSSLLESGHQHYLAADRTRFLVRADALKPLRELLLGRAKMGDTIWYEEDGKLVVNVVRSTDDWI